MKLVYLTIKCISVKQKAPQEQTLPISLTTVQLSAWHAGNLKKYLLSKTPPNYKP